MLLIKRERWLHEDQWLLKVLLVNYEEGLEFCRQSWVLSATPGLTAMDATEGQPGRKRAAQGPSAHSQWQH